MLPRFHAPGLAGSATHVTLDAEQSHHLARVLRLREGDAVRVFDGHGREWEGRVAAMDRRAAAAIADLRRVEPLAEPAVRLTVLAAVLRGAAMDALVHDVTMLGAARLVPVLSERVSVARRGEGLHAAHARWERIAIATARQCGRASLPAIDAPAPLPAALAAALGVRLWLAEPTLEGDVVTRVDELAAEARDRGATLAIGPEGGWAPGEVEAARVAGFRPWTLGPLVIRAESVPLAAVSVLRYAWG